jgi:type III restriction enzyme
VLRMWEPVIIMDEAHNARTQLSFETLERFNPSCIIEFTATPQWDHDPEHGKHASNVLAHTSAAQLKAEEMIKLPIKLHTRPDWREVLHDTVRLQSDLENVALREQELTGEYIRPIVLVQSQPHRQNVETITVEVIKDFLLNDCSIPGDWIAVATGTTREIEGVDLFDNDCPIRFIITQQALKEGWDCSFAYVFCSVADTGSARAAEQLLGRVLRLPNAKSKQNAELNKAYAAISSQRFMDTLDNLAEALVENGFQAIEARRFVTCEAPGDSLFVSIYVMEEPDLSHLSEDLREYVSYDAQTGVLTVPGNMQTEQKTELESCFTTEEGREAVHNLADHVTPPTEERTIDSHPIRVPALCIEVDGALEMFEESHFLDTEWDLSECDPTLNEQAYSSEVTSGADGELDVTEAGKIEKRFVNDVRTQLMLLRTEGNWTSVGLVSWLDRNISHPDVTQVQTTVFINKVITALIESRGVSVDQLTSDRYRLCRALTALIGRHRQEMRNRGYEAMLLGPGAVQLRTSPEVAHVIDPEHYAPYWYYEGGYQFNKHAVKEIGQLNAEGEEFECARFIDNMLEVKRWVRNLERRPDDSFWLPTSTDRFYPDFVAELEDGRFLVVEYKSELLWSTDDSKEKRFVGDFWAAKSDGGCCYVMPNGPDWPAIEDAIS